MPSSLTASQAYVQLSFSLIETFLADIGITPEEFAQACQEGIHRGGEDGDIIARIIAVDDFVGGSWVPGMRC